MESMQKVIASLDAIIARTEIKLSSAATKPEGKDPEADVSANKEEKKEKNKKEKKEKDKKEKKEKKEKKKKTPPAPAVPPATAQFLQCDLRVGKVVSVSHHPEADGLYVLSISYGDKTRSVCAGLRGYVEEDDLHDSFVVTICNLKPRMLRGVPSEAMILAGSVRSDGTKESVLPLAPPADATPGDIVLVRDMSGERTVTEGKFVSGKTWDKVVPRLSVTGGKACYDGKPLVVANVDVECALPDGAEIH